MSATAWFAVAVVGFSLAGIALIAAVILFFKLKIRAIIGDLTGKTVAREVKAIRQASASNGEHYYRPAAVNPTSGKMSRAKDPGPQAMNQGHGSKRLGGSQSAPQPATPYPTGVQSPAPAPTVSAPPPVQETEQLSSNAVPMTANMQSPDVTEVLPDTGVTEVLPEQGGARLREEDTPTDVLGASQPVASTGVTEVLPQTGPWEQAAEVLSEETSAGQGEYTTVLAQPAAPRAVSFRVVKSILVVHTDEVIGGRQAQ